MGRAGVVVVVAAVLLGACGGDDDDGAASATTIRVAEPTTVTPTTMATTSSTTLSTSTTTTAPPPPTIDSAANKAAINEFIDAIEFHQQCSTLECLAAAAIINREEAMWTLTFKITDPTYFPMVKGAQVAYDDFSACIKSASTMDEFSDQLDTLDKAMDLLYDALRG